MPPKRSRGARASAAVPAAAPASSTPPPTSSATLPEDPLATLPAHFQPNPRQADSSSASDARPEVATNGALFPRSADLSATIGPQSSPPLQPAPAPILPPSAPTIPRPPITQRLASIMPPRTPSVSGRGGVAIPSVARPKFSGRRSQTARLELEQQEAERRKAEAELRVTRSSKGAERDAGGAGRRYEGGEASSGGRGRGFVGRGLFGRGRGRGRGGFMGESERVMSGPFGSGMVNQAEKGKGGRATEVTKPTSTTAGTSSTRRVERANGGTESRGASEGVTVAGPSASTSSTARPARTTKAAKSSSTTVATADGKSVKPDPDGDTIMTGTAGTDYISSGSDDEATQDVKSRPRRNVDEMVAFVDLTRDRDDDDEVQGMQPVRLRRDVHKERTLGVNADGTDIAGAGTGSGEFSGVKTSEKRKGKQRARIRDRDLEITGESRRVNATTYSSSESEADGRWRVIIKSEPVDDDANANAAAAAGDASMSNAEPAPTAIMAGAEVHSPPSSPEARRKAKESVKLAADSAAHPPPDRPAYQTQEEADEWSRAQEDVRVLRAELSRPASDAIDGDRLDPKADKVYLFQFPPVLPDLRVVVVKDEAEVGGATVAAAAAVVDGNTAGTAVEVEGAKESSAIKIPDSAATSAAGPPSTCLPRLPSGLVGKLRVHASGKVTLDWGGTPLVLGRGTDASFLQDIMVARLPDVKKEDLAEEKMAIDGDDEIEVAVLMSMGQVRGKFVVTPDWEEILG